MGTNPQLTEADIRRYASDQSFSRGMSYYNHRAVRNMARIGNKIQAQVHGTHTYQVTIQLEDGDLEMAHCTCPFDWGGVCKHIVAVLLTYIRDPASFVAEDDLASELAQMSTTELITLIEKMLDYHPDLLKLVKRPKPARGSKPRKLDLDAIRAEVTEGIESYDGWGDETPSRTIRSMTETADAFADAGEWNNAYEIYRITLEESLNNIHWLAQDYSGDAVFAAGDIVDKLALCLEQPEIKNDDQRRQNILDLMMSVMLNELGWDGFGDLAPDYIERFAKAGDLPAIRNRMQEYLDQQTYSAVWLEEFLVKLDMLAGSDIDTVLARLREEERYFVLISKLIDLDRLNAAVETAKQWTLTVDNHYQFVTILFKLHDEGKSIEAIEIAESVLSKEYDWQMARWLIDLYDQRGDHVNLLRHARTQMQNRPSLDMYHLIKKSAQALEQWDQVRPAIITQLKNQTRYAPLLIDILLGEQEWVAAWETLDEMHDHRHNIQLELKVAHQTQHIYPDRAENVYIRHVERLIKARGRSNYADAVSLLRSVQDIYRSQGRDTEFTQLVQSIREANQNLPALQDEINKVRMF